MKIELRVDSRPLSGLVREGFSESIMLHQDWKMRKIQLYDALKNNHSRELIWKFQGEGKPIMVKG